MAQATNRVEKGTSIFLSSPAVSLDLVRFDSIEERSGKSFAIASTTPQVAGLEVVVESVGSTGARVVRVVREEG